MRKIEHIANVLKDGRSANMRAIRSKDTKPELIVRRLIFNLGYRYRLHHENLPGKPDLAFLGKKKVVFVHGCFWHQHSSKKCKIAHQPKTNLVYWLPKLKRNKTRDRINKKKLAIMGWKSLIIWECEIKDLSYIERKILKFLDP